MSYILSKEQLYQDLHSAYIEARRHKRSRDYQQRFERTFIEDAYSCIEGRGTLMKMSAHAVWKAKSGDAGWFKPSTDGKGRKIKDDGSEYKTAEDRTFSNTYAIGTDPCLFFPAAGDGFGFNLSTAGASGFYWSSTLYSSETNAYSLNFNSSNVKPQYSISNRYHGFSVRPVSD